MTYNQILALSEEAIKDCFPKGAQKVGQARWIPAPNGRAATKTLKRLLKDKRERVEPPRIMKPGSGYTTNPAFGLGKERRHSGEFGEAEPESVDAATQERFSREAIAKEDRRREVMRSRLAQIRALGIEHIKADKDPTPLLDETLERFKGERAA